MTEQRLRRETPMVESSSVDLSLVIFTAPGVAIGGQLGPFMATHVPQSTLEKSLGVLFVTIASLTLGQLILSSSR
jgi:uncharacterized membrane protein YfcA